MKNWFFVLLYLVAVTAKANGNDEYAVANIPAALMKNANVVKRFEVMRFEITEGNKAAFYRKVAFTVLNEQGDRWGSYSEWYDKLRTIESFEGTLFDATGKKVKSLKKSDIKDVSGSDDASLADDNRVKWHSFFYKVYPYTVEYEVEVRYKGTMFLPTWTPQERPIMGVQSSKLIVVSPASNPLHYKMFNYKGTPVITDQKSDKVYNWEAKEILPEEPEYAAPEWRRITTSVFMATEKFIIEDYEGSNASWKDFGKFVYDLKKNRDVLPDDVKQKVHQLTDGLTDPNEKVRKLYEYMQQNTRYISIQLGVGGWQPFDAKYVSTKKYGDCKALSNFMYSLLKEAGIKSVYALIKADDDDDYLMVDLPSSQFNHAILFVPHGKDTTWLECTSQTKPAGYLGGIGNRYAVAIDEDGGSLVRTPRYGVNENLEIRNTTATIDEEGNLQALIKTKYKAEQQDRLHAYINGLSKDKLMEFLKEDIELATYDVNSFDYKEEKGILPVVSETLDLVAANYATVSGKRFFVVPNIITRTHRKIKAVENRKNDLILDFEFKDIDTSTITIPAGYTSEAIPADAKIESKFGKYRASVKLEGNKIIYYRHYEHYSGRFPAKDYAELVKFYEAIYKADRNKVVLVKNETAAKGF
jgi:transglutaminase-like putative cysteine protease